MDRRILVSLVAMLSLLAIEGAWAASLSGFVRDADSGEPVAYANVFVRGELASKVALCNAEGYYSLPNMPAGSFRVSAQAVGYRASSDSVSVPEGADVRHDVRLEPAPVDIKEIEVVGDPGRKEEALQPGFVALEARKLQRLPAVGEPDLVRSLQLLPGVQAASDISSGLYIRGGGPDQTLILLDQIPLYNPTHAFGFFSTFNPDAIKDVNLYKGAYPAQYGGRLGSVLEVTNREGNKNEFHGRGGVSILAARLTLEGPVGRGSWIVSGRRTYLDPILSLLRTDTNEIPEYYFYDLNARVTQEIGPADRLTMSGYFGRDDLFLDLDEGSFLGFRWGNAAATAKWTHIFSPRLFGNFLLAGTHYDSESDLSFFETPFSFTNGLNDLTAQADVQISPGGDHVLTAGTQLTKYDFSFEQEFNRDSQAGLDQQPWSVVVYGQDQWSVSPFTTARFGLHTRYFSEGERFVVEPRLAIRKAIANDVALKFATGGYHQFIQLISTEGFSSGDLWIPTDATTEPGRSIQGVIGAEWEHSDQYAFSAEAYYTGLDELVQYDNDVAIDASGTTTEDLFMTGGRGWATGFELFAERRLGAITGWVGYTLGWSRRTFDELNQGNSFPPKYDRRHDFEFVAEARRGKWRYGASFLYGTGQAFTPAGGRYSLRDPATGFAVEDDLLLPADRNSARLLPYHRLDVSATRIGHLFGMKAEYTLQIFNLYSRRNDWFIQYDTDNPTIEVEIVKQLPIVPSLGVSFEF